MVCLDLKWASIVCSAQLEFTSTRSKFRSVNLAPFSWLVPEFMAYEDHPVNHRVSDTD